MGQSALSPANSRVAPFCFLNKTRVYAAPEATASRKGSFPERAKEGVTREDRRVCPGCRAISHAMSRLIREIAAPRKRGFLVASILYIYLSLFPSAIFLFSPVQFPLPTLLLPIFLIISQRLCSPFLSNFSKYLASILLFSPLFIYLLSSFYLLHLHTSFNLIHILNILRPRWSLEIVHGTSQFSSHFKEISSLHVHFHTSLSSPFFNHLTSFFSPLLPRPLYIDSLNSRFSQFSPPFNTLQHPQRNGNRSTPYARVSRVIFPPPFSVGFPRQGSTKRETERKRRETEAWWRRGGVEHACIRCTAIMHGYKRGGGGGQVGASRGNLCNETKMY